MTAEERAKVFLSERQTLVLATTGMNGLPTASHAPFVRKDGNFYVYTSALSRHTRDMQQSPDVSVMIMEDEVAAAANLFARKRLTLSCVAHCVPRGVAEWQNVLDLFEIRFGKPFELIKPLGDFTLFRLVPTDATYVEGFGQAYRLNKDLEEPVHIRGTGPGAKAHK